MIVTRYYANYTEDEAALVAYGFLKKEGSFVLEKNILGGDFLARLCFNKEHYEIKVFDSVFKEEYLPFNLPYSEGAVVGEIRAETDALLADVKQTCFVSCEREKQAIEYMLTKYNAPADYPWDDENSVYRLPNTKWFALIMRIPFEKLGIKEKGVCSAINLKNDPQIIPALIDNKSIFTCYHMNKTHWITVVMDKNITLEKLCALIDESYAIVNQKHNLKTRKRTNQ